MQDIPVFTTENGVASLALKDVPYNAAAYIRIQDSCTPELLLEECVSFCRAVGAERIYATGHTYLEQYPLYTSIVRMQCQKDMLPQTDAALFPVQEQTLETWRNIYNEKMRDVPSASYMTQREAKQMLSARGAYFVHRGDALLGIGSVKENKLESLASVIPGAGAEVVSALSNAVFTDIVYLEVASENHRAMHLYRKLGFMPTLETARWYCI